MTALTGPCALEDRPCLTANIAKAKATVRAFELVGVLEQLQEFWGSLAAALNVPHHLFMQTLQVKASPARPHVSDLAAANQTTLLRRMIAASTPDQEVYDEGSSCSMRALQQ